MKRILLFACWTGLASYCLLSSIVGPSGIVSTKNTQAASAAMRENLLNLQSLNSAYASEWDILRTSPEATALEARSLGYLAENEVVIRLSIEGGPAVPPSAGSRISFEPESPLSEKSIKHIALFMSLLSAIMGLVVRLNLPLMKYHHREIRTHAAAR